MENLKMGLNDNIQNANDILSLIYGDDIVKIYDRYVFVPEVNDDKSIDGYIYDIYGNKLLSERVDTALELVDGKTGNTDGYAVFLLNTYKELFNLQLGSSPIKASILVINKDKNLDKGVYIGRYYSPSRPDIVITYNFKVYVPRGTVNNIDYLISRT